MRPSGSPTSCRLGAPFSADACARRCWSIVRESESLPRAGDATGEGPRAGSRGDESRSPRWAGERGADRTVVERRAVQAYAASVVPEAPLEDAGSGLAPANDGWFVVNVRDARWMTAENSERKPPGADCRFESREAPFPQLGIKIRVLEPGQPNGIYHSENQQEDFLVLSGECRLLVESEERLLHAWDFVHCPPPRITSSSVLGIGRA
jgi:hypothetical protein